MADIFDQATEREIQEREIALSLARAQKRTIEATGFCLSCGEKVTEEKRWCDSTCRDDWEKWNPEA